MRLGPSLARSRATGGVLQKAVEKRERSGNRRAVATEVSHVPTSLLKEEREGERGENQTEVSYFVLKYAIFLLRK